MSTTDKNSGKPKRKRIPVKPSPHREPAIPDPVKPPSTKRFGKNAGKAGRIAGNGDPVPPAAQVPAGTVNKRPPCRFEMFVVLRTGLISYYPQQNRTFCFRGDKYTHQEDKMLHKLVNHYSNKRDDFFHMELYDNSLPREAGQRLIYKIRGGRVYLNRLNEYAHHLVNTALPEQLTWPK